MRSPEGRPPMIVNVVLLAVSALLLVYLVYALLRPEKF
jgi:K+-transporting ATPase KdpF subunit